MGPLSITYLPGVQRDGGHALHVRFADVFHRCWDAPLPDHHLAVVTGGHKATTLVCESDSVHGAEMVVVPEIGCLKMEEKYKMKHYIEVQSSACVGYGVRSQVSGVAGVDTVKLFIFQCTHVSRANYRFFKLRALRSYS